MCTKILIQRTITATYVTTYPDNYPDMSLEEAMAEERHMELGQAIELLDYDIAKNIQVSATVEEIDLR